MDNLVGAIAVDSMTERATHDFYSSRDDTVVAPANQSFDALIEAAPPKVFTNDTFSHIHDSVTYRSAMGADHDLELQL